MRLSVFNQAILTIKAGKGLMYAWFINQTFINII